MKSALASSKGPPGPIMTQPSGPRRINTGGEPTPPGSFPPRVIPAAAFDSTNDALVGTAVSSFRGMSGFTGSASGTGAAVLPHSQHIGQPQTGNHQSATSVHQPQTASHPQQPGAHQGVHHPSNQQHIGQVLPLQNAAPSAQPAANPAPVPGGGPPPQQQYQRLKVEDALSYLDQVKLQFGSQPQVYNDFLDIMKEFKSQSIDTPGVINRVSNLFKGHPDLIVGFNTFLPPGYKIEVHASDPNKINFTTPNQSIPKTIPLPITGPPLGNSGSPVAGSGGTGHPQALPAAGSQPPPSQGTQPSGFQNQIPQITKAVHQTVPQPITPSHAAAAGHTYSQPPIGSGPPHPNRGPANAQQNQQNNGQTTSGGQPVEFNHAINYVNKIKNRFQGQPEIYKAFLEILHTYQKEQRAVKESGGTHTPSLSETQVFEQVATLFKNQEDLLQEFGQFLPDANGSAAVSSVVADIGNAASLHNDHQGIVRKFEPGATSKSRTGTSSNRKSTFSHSHMSKKQKLSSGQGVSLIEARKHGSLSEFAFFDKVRKAFKSQDVYENFLRCLLLFNQEIVSRAELVLLVSPFLGKYPELLKWFKEFLGYKEQDKVEAPRPHKERSQGELYTEIDFSNCKRCGASYRALPKSYSQPKCSGRTALCNQVINDTWVSFPSWSEDSTFVTSRKTQYEEHIYRCEDERYELDIVIEVNTHTIRALEHVNKKLSRMSAEEASKFKLDNCLGGTSEVLHRKAIQRIYGDKAPDIIEGLKKNPAVAVPLVLKRLKLKEDEWKEAQRNFNKIWREQNEKYYLKSLDHQGLNFKQNDVRALRSKSLLNDIETIFDERQENGNESGGPHLNFVYADKAIIQDAAALIIHHTKRQTGIHKEEKERIKQVLQHFLPDLFFGERGELSDDEDDDEDMETDEHDEESQRKENCEKKIKTKLANGPADRELWSAQHDVYHVFFANNNWYLFFRLHHILCERLQKMKRRAEIIAESDGSQKKKPSKVSTAVALGLKTPLDVEPEDYYSTLLEMVRNVLDGNMESNIYEDQLREMFGIHAYLAFTLDKVVQNIVRQCQNLVAEDSCLQITELYLSECGSGGTGGTVTSMSARSATEAAYQRKVEQLLADENCFKITYARGDSTLGIELLDTEEDHSDDPVEVGKWSSYMQKYVSQGDTPEELRSELSKKPVFLPRNLRRSRQRKETFHFSNNKEKTDSRTPPKPESTSVLSPTFAVDKTKNNEGDKSLEDPVKEEPMETDQLSAKKENGEAKEEAKEDMSVNHVMKQEKKNGESNMDLLDGVDMVNNMECKFNLNSYKMVYVVDSEDYMYRRSSLKKAKQAHTAVTENMANKFDKWHAQWRGKHVTEQQEEETSSWFKGHIDGLVPCETYPFEYVTANGKAMRYSVTYPEKQDAEES